MSLAEEVAAALRAAIEVLDEQRAVLRAAAERLTTARAMLTRVARQSSHEQLTRSLAAQDTAVTAADNATAFVHQARTHLIGYGPTLGFDLDAETSGPAAAPLARADPNRQSVTEPGRRSPSTAGQPTIPRRVLNLARRLPARQPGDRTNGYIIGPDGVAVAVSSGRRPANLDGLHRRFRPVSVDHAEGHAASLLRRSTTTDATIVINNRPCEGSYGCDASLPAMLPVGKTLHVYVASGDGTVTWYGTYHGTGEGIA